MAQHIREINTAVQIAVVAGVVQKEAVSVRSPLHAFAREGNFNLVALRLSANKYSGRGSADTGNRLFSTQLSPTARRQQEASFQTEVRKKVGLMYQQQLQRVDSLEQWQPQLVAQKRRAERRVRTPTTLGRAKRNPNSKAQLSDQRNMIGCLTRRKQTMWYTSRRRVRLTMKENRIRALSESRITGSRNRQDPATFEYPKDPDQAIQPTLKSATSQSTQTNDVSERIQHQDSQRPAIKQEEESQNEEQQQRAPQQTRARNNRRRITDQCLRQRGGLPGAPLGLCLRDQNMSAGEKSLFDDNGSIATDPVSLTVEGDQAGIEWIEGSLVRWLWGSFRLLFPVSDAGDLYRYLGIFAYGPNGAGW
ncbi:hypothetical protein AnigIFM59636_004907 [Aspergillus niger]|nr:hypothetical protein AnigIFM59636_004907 [Aspergillus niger]